MVKIYKFGINGQNLVNSAGTALWGRSPVHFVEFVMVIFFSTCCLGVVVYTCNPSIWDMETGNQRVWSQHGIFETPFQE